MGRTVTLLTAWWALAVLPAMCTAGWLVHPCECESTSGCSHETECTDDPCNATVLVRASAPLQVVDAYPSEPVVADAPAPVVARGVFEYSCPALPEPLSRPDIPCHRADLPLLI